MIVNSSDKKYWFCFHFNVIFVCVMMSFFKSVMLVLHLNSMIFLVTVRRLFPMNIKGFCVQTILTNFKTILT